MPSPNQEVHKMETIIGLFHNHKDAERALDALEDAGFTRDALSLVAQEGIVDVEDIDDDNDFFDVDTDNDGHIDAGEGAAMGATEGGIIGGIAGLLAGIGAIAIPGVGPVIAAGTLATALATTIGGAAIGAGSGAITGGLVGALVDAGVPDEHAHTYVEGVRRGGVLLTVHAHDSYADLAKNLMRQAGAADVNDARETWMDEGWPGVIAAVPPTQYH
jgi:hypothetical protein